MSLLTDGAKGGSAAWKKTKLRAETLFNTWATTVNAGQAATGCRKWDALPASVLCTRPVYEKYAQYLVHEYTSANRPMDHRPAGSPPAHESEKSGPGHSVVAPQRFWPRRAGQPCSATRVPGDMCRRERRPSGLLEPLMPGPSFCWGPALEGPRSPSSCRSSTPGQAGRDRR